MSAPHILRSLRDGPNAVTLGGLTLGVAGIYLAMRGMMVPAMMCGIWAVYLDWVDGMLARIIPDRSQGTRLIGAQLDSLTDVVASSVFPAVVLLHQGDFSPWFLPGALLIVLAGVLRLSHFNVYGCPGNSYHGLSVDNNNLVLAAVYLLSPWLPAFTAVVYATVVLLAILNVSPIRTPKGGDRGFKLLTAYVMTLQILFTFRL